MKKRVYLTAFVLTLAAAAALLVLGTLLPQKPIDIHVAQSAGVLMTEGDYPRLGDGAEASTLDNWSDAMILAQSKAMHTFSSVFTNPKYELGDGEGKVIHLYAYTQAENPQPTESYARYWMGFRTILRLLLVFFTYSQIRRYTAVAFFLLLAAVLCSVSKHVGTRAAFAFGAAMALVRPYVIGLSVQFACCFFLAFGAMLLMPRLADKPRWDGVVFLMLGMLTMYFDFYTTPILTFGMPMLYLHLLRKSSGGVGIKKLFACLALWAAGYVGMWIAKLVLTSLLTEVNGLENGIQSMIYRLGVRKNAGEESYYRPLSAVRAVWYALYADKTGEAVALLALLCTGIAGIAAVVRCGGPAAFLRENAVVLLVGLMPLVWLVAATQPTCIHYWFQYRSVALTFWAAALTVCGKE